MITTLKMNYMHTKKEWKTHIILKHDVLYSLCHWGNCDRKISNLIVIHFESKKLVFDKYQYRIEWSLYSNRYVSEVL